MPPCFPVGPRRGWSLFLRPGAVLFFAHNLLHAAQHAQARRQPGIDTRRGLADQPRTQHEAVRGDLRLGRGFLECRQEGASEAQGSNPLIVCRLGAHPNPEVSWVKSPVPVSQENIANRLCGAANRHFWLVYGIFVLAT